MSRNYLCLTWTYFEPNSTSDLELLLALCGLFEFNRVEIIVLNLHPCRLIFNRHTMPIND